MTSSTDSDGLTGTAEVALDCAVCGVEGAMYNFLLVAVVVDAFEFTEGRGDVMFNVLFAFAVIFGECRGDVMFNVLFAVIFGVFLALAALCRARSLFNLFSG